MAYPILYPVTYSYTGFEQAQQGISAFPGTQLDADLAGLSGSISSLDAFVKRSIRSDGALVNGLVTYDSLAPALQTAGIAPALPWVPDNDYFSGVSVVEGAKLYRCLLKHQSGTFATDLAAGCWLLVLDLSIPVVLPTSRVANSDLVFAVSGTFMDTTLGATSGNTFAKLQVFTAGGTNSGELQLNTTAGDIRLGSSTSAVIVPGYMTVGGTINIATVANSFQKAFSVVQSGPTSGSSAGPFLFNHFETSFNATLTGSGDPGNPGSATVIGYQYNLNVGGASFNVASAMVASFGLIHTAADTQTGDKVGISAGVYSSASTLGSHYGGTTAVTMDNGASAAQLVGFEVDTYMFGTASTNYRIGVNVWNGGTGVGSVINAAYAIGNRGGTISGAPVSKWKQGFVLYTSGGLTNKPMADDADLFYCDHTATLANIFNFPSVTPTGYILNFPKTKLADGALTLGTNLSAGGIGLNGPSGAANFVVYQQAGVAAWTAGLTTVGDYALANVPAATLPFRIDHTTSQVVVGNGLAVTGGATIDTINSATIDENGWSTYTPTVGSGTGAITASTKTGRYRRLFGKTVIVRVHIVLTTVGTAGGALTFSLPLNASTALPDQTFSGRESSTTGKVVAGGLTSATTAYCNFYDSTSVFSGGNGTLIDATLIYEAA